MEFHRATCGPAELVLTDAGLDLGRADDDEALLRRQAVADALGAPRLQAMRQVHGADVARVGAEVVASPVADALVTAEPGTALLVRVADCTPVVLVAPERRVVGVVHAGREGLVAGVVPAALAALGGGQGVEAWVGPRACGRCYEVPRAMADSVEAAVPGTGSRTSWGTPALDIGAGVVAQLRAAGAVVHDVGADTCTLEDETLFSHRRQGETAGRMGAAVVLTR